MTYAKYSTLLRAATLGVVFAGFLSACGSGGSYDGSDETPDDVFTAREGEACMGLLGVQCESGLYCDVEDLSCGAADATGICKITPEVCAEIFAPVCACNDVTYANACEAAKNGLSINAVTACPAT